jgi:hypothetical protein
MARRRDELQRIAAENFGWPQLTGEQLEAMEQVMAGHDVLAVLPMVLANRTLPVPLGPGRPRPPRHP